MAQQSMGGKPRRRTNAELDELQHPLLGDQPTLQLMAPKDATGESTPPHPFSAVSLCSLIVSVLQPLHSSKCLRSARCQLDHCFARGYASNTLEHRVAGAYMSDLERAALKEHLSTMRGSGACREGRPTSTLACDAGFGQKKDKKGFFNWYFNSRKVKEPSAMARTTPMRIEPKTFFANERTFLSWLHMAVTIGSIAAALLGFAGVSDSYKKPGIKVGLPHRPHLLHHSGFHALQ